MTTDPLLKEILACENSVWEALAAGDAEADAAALSEDFLGIYPDGFAGKESHFGQLSGGPTVARFELSDTRVMALGQDHVLLAYRAAYLRTGSTEEEEMFVASIWRRTAAGWANIFSQDTPATGVSLP